MNRSEAVIEGTLKPDGTLDLDEKPELPPGRVVVTVRPRDVRAGRRNIVEVLQEIWRRQQARGFQGRSKEEIDAEVNALRNEFEERQEELGRIRRKLPPSKDGWMR